MRDLNYQLKLLCKHSHEGSFETRVGGPTKKALTLAQQQADQRARLTISGELGHVREQITAVYIGR